MFRKYRLKLQSFFFTCRILINPGLIFLFQVNFQKKISGYDKYKNKNFSENFLCLFFIKFNMFNIVKLMFFNCLSTCIIKATNIILCDKKNIFCITFIFLTTITSESCFTNFQSIGYCCDHFIFSKTSTGQFRIIYYQLWLYIILLEHIIILIFVIFTNDR